MQGRSTMKIRTVKSILVGLCVAALLVGCGSGYANSSTGDQMYEGAAADYEAKEEAYATADTYDTDEAVGAAGGGARLALQGVFDRPPRQVHPLPPRVGRTVEKRARRRGSDRRPPPLPAHGRSPLAVRG